jgi:hypothetical protein
VALTYSASYLGGWDRRIAWGQGFQGQGRIHLKKKKNDIIVRERKQCNIQSPTPKPKPKQTEQLSQRWKMSLMDFSVDWTWWRKESLSVTSMSRNLQNWQVQRTNIDSKHNRISKNYRTTTKI